MARAGFTLLEIMIVVGIIVVLATIAVSVAPGIIDSQKAKQTKVTVMETLASAIHEYSREQPMSNTPVETFSGSTIKYKSLYGTYPPSPVSPMTLDDEFGNYGPTAFDRDDTSQPRFKGSYSTKEKFELIVRSLLVPRGTELNWHVGGSANWKNTDDVKDAGLSIECLLLFIHQLSSGAEKIVERLPAQYRTNADKDSLTWNELNGAPETRELFEVNDAWGRPLRYAVQVPLQDNDGNSLMRKWELRSAGPDGKFEPTFDADGVFTLEDAGGDDVILRGP